MCCMGTAGSQPYLDIISVKYMNSPDAGLLNRDKNPVKLKYFNAAVNIPIQFNNKKDAVIISPFFEQWSSKIDSSKRQYYTGIGLPVTLSKYINSKWTVLVTGILRLNDSSITGKTRVQAGGAFITNYKTKENLTWKLGLYVNNELFGVFVMPLAGIDWRINERNNLFGLLPGNLTYEHKMNGRFSYGATFRAITNSYARNNGYWRVDENQLGLFLDIYPVKNFALTAEAGHSLFRKIRTGVKEVSKLDAKVNDNLYFRIGLAYRVRFDKKENK